MYEFISMEKQQEAGPGKIRRMTKKKSTVDFASEYRDEFNLSIIPVNRESKKPLIQWKSRQKKCAAVATIRAWWKQFPDAAIGIVTGNISKLFVIDCDTAEGYHAIQDILPKGLQMPVVKTPRGWHLFFKYPRQSSLTTGTAIVPGVDFRGEGGYVVAAPSVNGKGAGWQWEKGKSLAEIKPPEMPQAIIEFIEKHSKQKIPRKEQPQKSTNSRGFAMITNEIIKSPAYIQLSNSARVAFMLLRAQIQKKGQTVVKYPYSDAENYMQRRTFTKAIRQLIEFGFISIEQPGGLYRRTNVYEFKELWREQ